MSSFFSANIKFFIFVLFVVSVWMCFYIINIQPRKNKESLIGLNGTDVKVSTQIPLKKATKQDDKDNLEWRCQKRSSPVEEIFDFEGFDNENGSDKYIVPNIVHLIYMKMTSLKFDQMITIFSIFLNHNPDKIYIHCDNCSFHGRYWEQIMATRCLKEKIVLHRIPFHDTIFGTKVKWIEHRSDVLRALILMTYGGIYLDNDVYVINSLDKYRKFEMTLGWEVVNSSIGSQVFIAHSQARFLKAFFDQYRYQYKPYSWYWNPGIYPAEMLVKYSYLANTVPNKFGVKYKETLYDLYRRKEWPEWKSMDTIHLLVNHRYYSDVFSPIEAFDEYNIRNYDRPIGVLYRDVIARIKPYLVQLVIDFGGNF